MIKLWCKKDYKTEVLTAVSVGFIEGPSNSPRKITLNEVEKADFFMLKDMNGNEIDEYIKDSGCDGSSGAVIVEYLLEKGFAKINGDLTVFQSLPISCINRMIDEIKNM
ncbi:hypothetical protein M9Y10_044408 [Tritrichomonas musculus]|uniref:Uncharacterized protein n=1 Tax=Tritrichomonas musculus TaxID=1915356 RepID=A0ABR2JSN6_9EUKA